MRGLPNAKVTYICPDVKPPKYRASAVVGTNRSLMALVSLDSRTIDLSPLCNVKNNIVPFYFGFGYIVCGILNNKSLSCGILYQGSDEL